MGTLSIRNRTRQPVPRFAYARAARLVLPSWDLSLVFVSEANARALNKKLRGTHYAPNVLSYESGTRSGEIIICPRVAKREAPSYGIRYPAFSGFLFIHGLLHLKGERHGNRMEKSERTVFVRIAGVSSFLTHGQKTHRNRRRHRDQTGQGSRR